MTNTIKDRLTRTANAVLDKLLEHRSNLLSTETRADAPPKTLQPAIPTVPLLDRLIAKATGHPLITVLARRSGLDLLNSSHSPHEQERLAKKMTRSRIVQLFYIDSTTNSSALWLSLLENHPQFVMQMFLTLSRQQCCRVLRNFDCPVPALSNAAATTVAELMTRIVDRKGIMPLFEKVYRKSTVEVAAHALETLYRKQRLDYGLLNQLSCLQNQAGLADDLPQQDWGSLVIATCHEQAHLRGDSALFDYLQIYMDLIYRALPRYREYWSLCTEAEQHDCPVHTEHQSLLACMRMMTPELIRSMTQTTCEDSLLSLTARKDWKRIHSRSTATLRHADAATGDFIYRSFVSWLQSGWNSTDATSPTGGSHLLAGEQVTDAGGARHTSSVAAHDTAQFVSEL